MKIVLVIIALVIGYLIGSFFPVKGFFRSNSASISGSAELKVTVLRPDNSPATSLEVDIGTSSGKVLEGGHETTDSNGVATFHVKPNTYSVFFNAINFPKGLIYKDTVSINVVEDKANSQTIVLEAN